MPDIIAVLLSWAVTLSGYPAPTVLPVIHFVPHHQLEEMACDGKTCGVLGWHPPGIDLYFDDRMDPENSTTSSSIIVHEMVHFLQEVSHKYPSPPTCDQLFEMEQEAGHVQRDYLTQYGRIQTVGRQTRAQMQCVDAVAPAPSLTAEAAVLK